MALRKKICRRYPEQASASRRSANRRSRFCDRTHLRRFAKSDAARFLDRRASIEWSGPFFPRFAAAWFVSTISPRNRAARRDLRNRDRKSTRLTPVTFLYLVCRLLLE